MGSNDEYDIRLQARQTFWKAAQDGLFRVLEKAPTVWKGRDARFYRAEKQIIMERVEPFYWGFVVTAFLFATFRVSGSKTYIRFRDSYIFNKHASPVAQQPQKTPQKWTGHLERESKRKEELKGEASRLPSDLIISMLVGCSSVFWLSKPKLLHEDFSAAPLVSGRSLIHQYMCPDLVNAYGTKVDPRVFRSHDDDFLITFETFVKNCKIRSSVISDREKAGAERPDVIPYPGIKGVSR
jgi:hypothetical protein